MTLSLWDMTWPASAVDRALAALVARCGLGEVRTSPGPTGTSRAELEQWANDQNGLQGIDLQSVTMPVADIQSSLAGAAPALIYLPAPARDMPPDDSRLDGYRAHPEPVDGARLLVLSGRTGSRCELIAPDGKRRRVVAKALCTHLLSAQRAEEASPGSAGSSSDDGPMEAFLASLPPRRRERVRAALFEQSTARVSAAASTVASARAPGIALWLVRPGPAAPLRVHLRDARAWIDLALLFATHAAAYMALVLSWWLIGRATFAARYEPGILIAWGLSLASVIPLRMLATWLQGRLAVGLGARLKRFLLCGALRMDQDSLRRTGVGGLFGRVAESEALGDLLASAGFAALLASAELLVAAWVLTMGAGGAGHAVILALWIGAVVGGTLIYARRRWRWTDERIALTLELVERMAGHRTRLVQQVAANWHVDEDPELVEYLRQSAAMDRASLWLLAVAPRGFMLLGLGSLIPWFVSAGPSESAAIAVSLGGIFLAHQGLERLSEGSGAAAGAWIAARRLQPFHDAAVAPDERSHDARIQAEEGERAEHCLQARNVSYRHATRSERVLKGCDLTLGARDRVLIEGPSGSGKSTLASVLAGLRSPASGSVLLGGLDRHTLGADEFRRRVLLVPQFHDNYVLSASFGFNLFLGASGPLTEERVQRGLSICRELGLAGLLERMPSGLDQMVGESGWQLSHGERSRLFIARALVQNPEVLILDESFAAMDPDNLRRCLAYTREQARCLVVIAHP